MVPSEEFLNNMTLQMRGGAEANAPDWKPTGRIKPLTEEDAKCPDITLERSQEIAMQISILNSFAFTIDEDYLAEAARLLRNNASMYDATAVLNRMWTKEHSELLQEQARALEHLAAYIQSNKRVTELRMDAKVVEENLSKVNNFFVV